MPSTPNLPPLPGFGLDLNHVPECRFPSALNPFPQFLRDADDGARSRAITLRELSMLHFMNAITDKKDWQVKIFDESIVNKWKAEIVADVNRGSGRVDGGEEEASGNGSVEETEEEVEHDAGFTQSMFEYCMDELRWKARLYEKSGVVTVFDGDVAKSDVAIPEDLQAALKAAVAPLENVPKNQKDWHPGSNEQVLDLVHPSLFPLVYGLSRILPNSTTDLTDCVARCGEGQVLPIPPDNFCIKRHDKELHAFSKKFQWLPCEVDISGDSPRILSYINNLYPKAHEGLYQVLETIIARIIPLWNVTLSGLRLVRTWDKTQRHNSDTSPQLRINYDCVDYDDDAWEEYTKLFGPEKDEDEDEDDFDDRFNDWESDHKWRYYAQPDVLSKFSPPEEEIEKVNLKRDFSDRGLQVIVKLANIHLTPEKPGYAGGSWHIEGQLNERICASAIYYYDCDNISPSHLAFRQTVHEPDVNYEQNDNDWIGVVFGMKNWEAAVQELGSVETREGRVITFPNIFQHQVQPFKLEDSTKPGHRKILALFLVDPNYRIISTANVPCQRRDWWGQSMMLDTEALARLPLELREKIIHDVEEFPVSMAQAKELREELMEERREYVIGYQDTNFKSSTISLCEH